jgi:hypothetical protein
MRQMGVFIMSFKDVLSVQHCLSKVYCQAQQADCADCKKSMVSSVPTT